MTVSDNRLEARPRVTLRLYIVFSVLMALSAVASGLFLLVLARPFVNELTSQQAERAAILLFTGAAVGGGIAALTGLIVGLRFAGRIRGIIEKAQAISGSLQEAPRGKALDEIGALDAAVGRLTLSIDRFVCDSDILARLPVIRERYVLDVDAPPRMRSRYARLRSR